MCEACNMIKLYCCCEELEKIKQKKSKAGEQFKPRKLEDISDLEKIEFYNNLHMTMTEHFNERIKTVDDEDSDFDHYCYEDCMGILSTKDKTVWKMIEYYDDLND